MRVLVSGAYGLIGSALTPVLAARGHEVVPLLRPRRDAVPALPHWAPEKGRVELGAKPFDAVVHLAGESIAQRWTRVARERIRRSRVEGTQLLARALTAAPQPPKAFISTSATGFYGSRGDVWLDESSPPGSGFLASVCQEWEAAANPARETCRVVHPRLGVVLTPHGGALARMLPVFRLGLGGRVGNGRQFWSWISLEDTVAALVRLLEDGQFRGPVNLVAPQPVTNAEFTRILGQTLRRPAFLPAPAWAIKVALGQMGEEALLSSARVRCARLAESGFAFRHPDLRSALEHPLGR